MPEVDHALLELKDELEYIGLNEMISLYSIVGGLSVSDEQEQGAKICRCIINLIKIKQEIRGLDIGTLIYDLKDFDPLFSFNEPPKLQPHHLLQALKAINTNYTPETLKKYAYIGFNREQIGQILGVDFYTTEQRQQLDRLQQQLQQASQKQIEQDKQAEPTTTEETKDQILVIALSELAKHSPNTYIWGGKFNKSAFARKCQTSEMSYLFKSPKGEEAYREKLKQLEIPLH